MQKFGGEKALTKQLHDEAAPKLHIPLEDATKLMLDGNTLGISTPCVTSTAQTIHNLDAAPKLVKPHTRAKPVSVKNRLEKILHKLYDLEPEHTPEKPLNVNLDVDLYQMEKY